jgi:hypothetical protein
MIVATLKVLTWGTVAAAVISAALLAAGGGSMLRAESADEAQVSRPKTMPVGDHDSTRAAPSESTSHTASQH